MWDTHYTRVFATFVWKKSMQTIEMVTGRHGYTSQNLLAICDFDLRFTFVVAGWAGSVHDNRILQHSMEKYQLQFPTPPDGNTLFFIIHMSYICIIVCIFHLIFSSV